MREMIGWGERPRYGRAGGGKAFADLPFDHLLFTGSTNVGRHILQAAAANLTPVTLELGGKSPVTIGKGADLRRVTERVALGKLLNAGQLCLGPDYLMAPRDSFNEVREGLRVAVCAMYPTVLDNPDYTSIVNDAHFERLTGLPAMTGPVA